ncbi:uncharacterized protein RSE6_09244 [Rhynchosporium secalis]|uniref:Uncharacterized protein n=1 Tax=Rhynchosporium secalis TaxID=38038 RepID=A0A1E1MIJ3_RHYSE|nr:uncharacterized protein RSE6_09244 [Rhynchosporium secalis]
MQAQQIIQIIILLSSAAVMANPLMIHITITSISTSTLSDSPCLCQTSQRGVFCGLRSKLFDPEHPIFEGNCDPGTLYTCVARGEYPFEPREALRCGYQGCTMVGGVDEAYGFDKCEDS